MTVYHEIFKRIVDAAASENKTPTQLAGECGVSPQRLFNWRRRGVPPIQVPAVSRALGGKLLPYQIRPDLPDLFPTPADDTTVAEAA